MSDVIEMSKGQSDVIVFAFFTGVLVCILDIILLLNLVYKNMKSDILQNRALTWQLISFSCYIICSIFYVFLRTDIMYGGTNNNSNYKPIDGAPGIFAMYILTYALGKISTDISWMFRVHTTFKAESLYIQYMKAKQQQQNKQLQRK